MSHILVVEDEAHIADGLRFNLEAEGFDVTVLGNGTDAAALLLAERDRFDAVLLDVMLPGKDGYAVVTELRAAGQFVPILMLTARGRAEDVLLGLEAGADDYVPKPFELSILLARLQGLLRRGRWQREGRPATPDAPPDVCTVGDRRIDFDAMEITYGSHTLHLTRMEADLLRYLVRNAGRAVPRRAILEDVWGLSAATDTRAVDNFIVRLRRYLGDGSSSPTILQTVRGVGYKLVLPG
ncbi:MAG: response regulator transcription factor [Vicinamibacterales bacterium]